MIFSKVNSSIAFPLEALSKKCFGFGRGMFSDRQQSIQYKKLQTRNLRNNFAKSHIYLDFAPLQNC